MKYKGFYIDITRSENIVRNDSSGNDVICKGYLFSVFTDETRREKFDEFSAAEGFEILSDSKEEAEQFAKDVVSCEDKAFRNDEPEMVMGGQL